MSRYLKPISKNAMALGAFAMVTALLLALTYSGTKDRIAAAQKAAQEAAFLQVLGDMPIDNDVLTDRVALPYPSPLNLNNMGYAQIARYQGEIVGILLPTVAPDGYSGKIAFIVGLTPDGQITGVRVTDHRETPGLGDKIDIAKDDWIERFAGHSLINTPLEDWAVKKEGGSFDAFTGATITPRAMINQILATLTFYDLERDALLQQARLDAGTPEDTNNEFNN